MPHFCRVLLRRHCANGMRYCKHPAILRRSQEREFSIIRLARIVEALPMGANLANTWIAAVLNEPAKPHQMKSIRTRAVLLGMLQGVCVHRKQVGLAESRVAVFLFQKRLEHAMTALVFVGHISTAPRTCRGFEDSRIHYAFARLFRRACQFQIRAGLLNNLQVIPGQEQVQCV